MNSHINNNTTTPNFLRILQTLPTYTNGNFTYLNNNYAYVIFNSNSSIQFKEDTPCELLIVGAGGRGGNISTFGGAGGGGSGQIIYNQSFTIPSNSYDIIIGIDSADSNQRISKIVANNQVIISAIGGGDGAYWDGLSFGEIQRYPPQIFTSNSPIITTNFFNKSCYKSTIYVNSNSYEVFYSSRKLNTSFDAINLFNCLEPSSTNEAVFLENQYITTQKFNYKQSNYLVDFTFKGDWICIKLPIPILLTSYSFFQNTTENGGAPNNFKIYGSINGIDWDTIKERNSLVNLSSYYLNYKYTETLSPLPTKPYLYYGLVVNSIIGSLGYLNFNEWVLNGKPIIISPSTINGGSSIFNLPSNQIQGGFGGSYLNENLIQTIKTNSSSINIPFDNHFFKINRNSLNIYINSGTYSAIFNEGFITFANETYLSFPILTSIEPEYWYKFNSSSGFNDNLIISGNITKNLNDIYFEYGAYLTPTINQLWNSNGISFSFWIKPEIDIGNNIWIFKTIENSNEFISFHKNEFKINNNGLITSINFNINLLDGLYHHFICSINPSGRIFVACDGIIYEKSSLNPFINKSYKDGRIGEFFQGSMKDFRIYLKVLDINEIQELFKGRIEIFYNRFNEIITTTNIQIGSGGIGGTASSIPTIKKYYGDGGDGNSGLGFKGVVIIKYPYPYFKTTITPYKFPNSQFLKFSGLNNSNGICFKLLTNKDDNRILSINDLNFNISSNNPYINSTSNIDINNALFINSNNTIGFGKKLGINNSFSINDFTIQKNNSNISFINPDGFFGIGTTNPLNFLDIRNDVFMSKLNLNSLEIKIINSNQNSLIIPENSRIFFNYINETKINSGIYDINFTNGSIICGYLNPDKSYPILKEKIRYYTEEREYPPKLYDSISTETTTTDILGKTSYKQILTLNTSGNYIIYSSSKLTSDSRTKSLLFNKNLNDSINGGFGGAIWNTNSYEDITGKYIGVNFIKNDYLGDWIILKLPVEIILTKFKFFNRYNTSQDVRAPGLWRCYGSIDGITFTEIIEASNDINCLTITNYSNGIYEKMLNNNILYSYIGFTFNKLIGGTNSTILNFTELVLFGNEKYEETTITIDPVVWFKFDDITNLEKDELNNFYLTYVNNPIINSTIFNKGIGSLSLSRQNNQYLIFNYLDFNDLSFSISLWSYLLSYDSDFTPLFCNENFIISYKSLNRTIVFGFNGNNLSGGDFPNDTNIWINWIFTYDKDTKKRKIYRNGLIIAEDISSSLYTPIIHIYNIGRLYQNNIANYFDGYIDDFRIYNKALNATQVQELYKGRIEIHSYLNKNSNLNIFGNASISGNANIGNLILNGVINKSDGYPYLDSGWTNMLEESSNIFNSYSVVGIGTTFPRFQNRLDVNGSIICNEVYVNGALLTNDYIKNSGTTAETIALGTLKISSGGTGVNSFTSNKILNSSIFWSNNSLNILGNLNNSNNSNERIFLNNGIRIGNVIIDNFGISNSNINIGNNFFIRSNVGIGTTNPINALDIRGNMRIRQNVNVSNISNNEILNGVIMNVSNISIENSGFLNKYLSRWGNSNNFMGFVGIGTTNPRNSLDIIGNVGIKGVLNVSNISNNEIFNGVIMNVSNINIENSVINYKNNSSFIGSRWNLSNSSIVYNSGFVGIRTNVLDSNLNINGNFDMKGFLDMNNSNISNIDWFGGKTLKINNLQFLTNSTSNINFINGNTLNLNNWTTNNSNSTKYVQTFSYTGGIQTFNIPLGVYSINIYCWGAGGGAGDTTLGNTTGGDGGFVKATLDVSSISSLKLIVGQGGRVGIQAGTTTTAFGGGGIGKCVATDTNYAPGSGGGLSGIFIDNANFYMTGDNNNFVNNTATAIIITGAGGGNGNRQNAGNEDTLFNGGNGGSDIANDGSTTTGYAQNGKGGTQITGGVGGTGAIANGNNGNKYSGGNANSYGGGGGAGWYGGGAGGVSGSIVGCGGGGSSYVNTSSYYITNITNLKTDNNNSRSPPGTTEIYYQTGIAVGASPPNNGGNGLIVIEYYISNTYYNYGNVGIKTSINQSNSLDINGDLNFNSNISNLNNQIFNFENYNGLITTNPVVNITNNSINNSYGFYQFVIANNITFNRDLFCDVLVVGAGGNGGAGAGSGGGGGGEVIYQPNYLFEKGSYNLSVGTSSTSTGNRISKIMKGTTEIFKALGGGDGNVLGIFTYTIVRQYPPKCYNSLSAETANTSINGRTCYNKNFTLDTSGISYGSGKYELYYIPTSADYTYHPFIFFDFDASAASSGGHFGGGGLVGTDTYDANGNYTGNNYLVSSSYLGAWMVIKFPFKILLKSYKIILRNDLTRRFPRNFIMYGSDNSTNWDIIENIVGLTSISNGYIYTSPTLSHTKLYNYYGLVVNKTYAADSIINPVEIQFFGTEIYNLEYISITGTGNTINIATDNNDFRYALFTNNGTFTINNNIYCDILIIGGGGGGGYDGAGGGGGGQVLYYTDNNVSFKSGSSFTLNSGTYNINIGLSGTGGTDATTNGTNGGLSSISFNSSIILSAKGGGGGGSRNNLGNGGDIGGAGGNGHYNSGASQTSSNNGGSGGTNSGTSTGGGGGGGGANTPGTSKNGENSQASRAGNGGAGVNINITGGSVGYGGGGGGGSYVYIGGSATHGGGAGNITNQNGNAQPGTANTGGGGGSGGHASLGNPAGATGGTGVVIIRYSIVPISITGIGNSINNLTENSNYNYAYFANDGTFSINKNMICDILVVGGGGSGGRTLGGGGGAGAVIYIRDGLLNSGTYNVVIGAGGAQTTANVGNKGNDSSFAGIIAEGGGFSRDYGQTIGGGVGGSGGGAGASEIGVAVQSGGAVGTSSSLGGFIGNIYGNRGGSGLTRISYLGGGGGGGAGSVGIDGNPNDNGAGGKGGDGIQINITGTNLYWGAGGGGAHYSSKDSGVISRPGNGGLGGGGGASSGSVYYGSGGTGGLNNGTTPTNTTGGSGGANTGSGGGAGGWVGAVGGAGGSGVVIIRYNNNINNINNIIKYSSGGSGGGSYYNSNNQSYTLAKWNNNYSYISTGNNGTNFIGGKGGSSLITSTYNLTGTNQLIGVGGLGATSSAASGSKTYGCGGDGNGGSGGSGIIIIKLLKENRNFNLVRNYLFNNGDYQNIKDDNDKIIIPSAWYKFNNQTNLGLDSSGNNKHLTNFNNVLINGNDYCRGNSSAEFNGTNYFQINEPSYFSPNNSFSISLWMKLTNLVNNYKSIFSCRSTIPFAGYTLYIIPETYNMELWIPDINGNWNATNILNNYFASYTNIWKHLVLTFNKRSIDNEIKIYLDGVLINTIINTSYIPNINNNFRLGSGTNETTSQYYLDNGSLINDFRYYSGIILNQSHVNQLYNLNVDKFYPIIKDNFGTNINPTAWYKFDDYNNIGFDSSGNGYHLTNNNSVGYNSSIFVKGSGSASFNSANSRYLSGTGVNINAKSFSISFWVYPTIVSDTYIYAKDNSTGVRYSLHIGYRTSTNFTFAFYGDDLEVAVANHLNKWNFFTCTYNVSNNQQIVYVNGVLTTSRTSGGSLNAPDQNYNIGRNFIGGSYYSGYLDDFRIYAGIELSQSQILELYENSRINFIINGNSISKGINYIASTNNYPLLTYANSNLINPIIWYKFDGSSSQMLLDSSGNGYNLTNNNSATYDTTNFIKGSGSVNFNHSSSQYLTIPSINLYNIQSVNGISFCLWFRMNTTNTGAYPRIFDFSNGNTITSRWIIISRYTSTDNRLCFDINNSTNQSGNKITTNNYIDGNWHHIIWCINSIGNWTIYIDGLLASFTSSLPTNINIENVNFTSNSLGKSLINGDGYLSGNIDDFRIYNFELSPNQVRELYNTTNNYTTLINYPTNYFSSYSSNLNNPFIRTSNNNLELLSYTNNNINSLLLESNIKLITNNNNQLIYNSNIISINNSLDIKGNSGTITNQGGAFFTTDVASSSYSNGYIPEYTRFSLRTFDNIICSKNSYALSDKRIKKNISNIDDESSLEKILRVEPKIYGYIDNIQRTNSNVYGFIAQQIRDILPEATELTTKFIPDIFKLVKINGNRINLNEEELKKIEIGDILEVYTKNNSYEVKVINKDNDGIDIDRNIAENDIFIYGRQVKDFHIIDKSYLYTLNICATQELARIVEGLKERINNL